MMLRRKAWPTSKIGDFAFALNTSRPLRLQAAHRAVCLTAQPVRVPKHCISRPLTVTLELKFEKCTTSK